MSQPAPGGPTDPSPLNQPGMPDDPDQPSAEDGCCGSRALPGGLEMASLVEQFAGLLYRYAFRLTGTVHDAEDLVQQTFAMAQQKLHTVHEPEKIQAWLLTCLRRHFYKSLRNRTATPASSLGMDVVDIVASPNAMGNGVQTADNSDQLQWALSQLPDVHRVALMMFYFEERSYQEIAEELEIPMGTVMSRLSRAKARLRGLLSPDGNASAVTRPAERTC